MLDTVNELQRLLSACLQPEPRGNEKQDQEVSEHLWTRAMRTQGLIGPILRDIAILSLAKIPTPIKIKLALPPPLLKTPSTPPLKGGILWAWGFFQQKDPKNARRP